MNVDVFNSFAELPAAVAQACSYATHGEFFRSLEWFQCVYECCLAQEAKPRIYAISGDRGDNLGVLFCQVRNGTRQLRSMTNFYSLGFGFTTTQSTTDTGLVRAWLDHVSGERPRWHSVDLSLLDEADALRMIEATPKDNPLYFRNFYHQYENWYIELEDGGNFETFFAARPSKMKNTVARKQKKLHKEHDVRIALITSRGSELDQAVADYTRIYESSWKRPEPYPTFMPTFANVCADLGLLRLGVLYVDDEPAAAQFWINGARTAIIYKLAYDERFSKQSVGSILSKHLFEHAIDIDGVQVIDYGVGSEPYKKDWMDSVKNLGGVWAPNRATLIGFNQHLLELAKRAAKSMRANSAEQSHAS